MLWGKGSIALRGSLILFTDMAEVFCIIERDRNGSRLLTHIPPSFDKQLGIVTTD